MKNIMYGVAIITGIAMFGIIAYGSWQLGRKISYSLSYEDMVKKTVKEMVKEECLRK